MLKFRIIAGLLPILFVASPIDSIFAAGGKLERPGVAMSTTVPDSEQAMIRKVLTRANCKFIQGDWVNFSTQLHYKSDTKALGLFLDELSKCPNIILNISFYQQGKNAMWAPEKSNWSVFHLSTDNRFNIRIRLDSEIDLSKLHLPELRTGPKSGIHKK